MKIGGSLTQSASFIIRFIIFALFHSLAATKWCKELFRINGCKELRWYRLAYNFISFLLFIYVMAAWRDSSVLYFIPGVGSLIMYLLQFIMALLILHCLIKTGIAEFIGISGNISSPSLIQRDYYAFVRHPLYLFSILFMLLNPVVTARWLTLTILSIIYFIIGAKIEENRHIEMFGSEYEKYRQRVPFIFPKISSK